MGIYLITMQPMEISTMTQESLRNVRRDSVQGPAQSTLARIVQYHGEEQDKGVPLCLKLSQRLG